MREPRFFGVGDTDGFLAREANRVRVFGREPFLHFETPRKAVRLSSGGKGWGRLLCPDSKMAGRGVRVAHGFAGRVGEWLKPADCKSAAPCGLRRFESSPVHQRLVGVEPHDRSARARQKRSVNQQRNHRTQLRGVLWTKVKWEALGKPVRAWVAQLVEHLICNQRVGGSTPSAS